jgi:hypothetical protein
MFEEDDLPRKQHGITKAGINIHVDPTDKNPEPLDINLDIIKPGDDEIPNPNDENVLTTSGKLSFKLGNRGSIEIYAENTSRTDSFKTEQEEDL